MIAALLVAALHTPSLVSLTCYFVPARPVRRPRLFSPELYQLVVLWGLRFAFEHKYANHCDFICFCNVFEYTEEHQNAQSTDMYQIVDL